MYLVYIYNYEYILIKFPEVECQNNYYWCKLTKRLLESMKLEPTLKA